MKKGQVTIFIIIALIIISYMIIVVYIRATKSSEVEIPECQTDSDCVPATCCHPDSCVPSGEKPDCSEIFCTLNCAPNTLDCDQAGCVCINNKCTVEFNE